MEESSGGDDGVVVLSSSTFSLGSFAAGSVFTVGSFSRLLTSTSRVAAGAGVSTFSVVVGAPNRCASSVATPAMVSPP